MSAPFAPIGVPVVVDERGHAWLPSRTTGRPAAKWFLHTGLSLAWVPLPGRAGALLHVLGGEGFSPGLVEGAAVTLTRQGMQQLIADLQSIDAQLEASR